MLTGIYKITNIINGKVYIGQSIDIGSRWKQHLLAKDNTNLHISLQENPLNFSFEILELCSKEELDQKEMFWINEYSAFVEGYNMTIGGKNFPIISNNIKCKKVNQYGLDGKFIKSFNSVIEAKQITGIGHIASCCRFERKTAGGYQWRYIDTYDMKDIEPCGGHSTKPVIQYTLQGDKINEYSSISEASRKTKILTSSIIRVCQKKGFSAGGFRWSYKNEELSKINRPSKRKVMQLSLEDEELNIFDSLKEAALSINKKNISGISEVCQGKRKAAYGYKWKFIE